jgi:hypothetical protein
MVEDSQHLKKTGEPCRACKQPVAYRDQSTSPIAWWHCPSCGFTWASLDHLSDSQRGWLETHRAARVQPEGATAPRRR